MKLIFHIQKFNTVYRVLLGFLCGVRSEGLQTNRPKSSMGVPSFTGFFRYPMRPDSELIVVFFPFFLAPVSGVVFFFVLWELDQQPLRIKKKANDSDFFARPPLRKNVAQKKKRRKNGRAIFPIPVCVCVCCCCRIASLTGPRVRNVSTRH